jgi:hypothetical protein
MSAPRKFCTPKATFQSPRAHVRVAFRDAARRRHEQRPGEVRGGVVQHARRVGDADAALFGCRDVDVVVAHRDVGDDLQVRRRLDHRGVDLVHHRGHEPVPALQAARELVGRPRPVLGVVLDVEAP